MPETFRKPSRLRNTLTSPTRCSSGKAGMGPIDTSNADAGTQAAAPTDTEQGAGTATQTAHSSGKPGWDRLQTGSLAVA